MEAPEVLEAPGVQQLGDPEPASPISSAWPSPPKPFCESFDIISSQGMGDAPEEPPPAVEEPVLLHAQAMNRDFIDIANNEEKSFGKSLLAQ